MMHREEFGIMRLIIFVLTVFSVLGAGWWLSRRIDDQIASLVWRG